MAHATAGAAVAQARRMRALSLVALAGASCAAPPPGPPTCGDPAYYRIDRVHYQACDITSAPRGFDFDGDGNSDDELEVIVGWIGCDDAHLPDMNATASARFASEVTWLAAVRTCDDGSQRAEVGESLGGNAAPITALVDPLGDDAPVVWIRIVEPRVQLTANGDGSLSGELGFLIPVPDSDGAIAAPVAAYLTHELALGQRATSSGPYDFARMIDGNGDGVVTTQELLASNLARALLEGDVFLDGRAYDSAAIDVHAVGYAESAARSIQIEQPPRSRRRSAER